MPQADLFSRQSSEGRNVAPFLLRRTFARVLLDGDLPPAGMTRSWVMRLTRSKMRAFPLLKSRLP
jgi:hypothetical protein